ncbi:MAG TPA: hypothetical protein VLZ77_15960, partial [Acidimicrobiales bacterium]|nr:hypothetical protein [Acidimicrobiales bacterium]
MSWSGDQLGDRPPRAGGGSVATAPGRLSAPPGAGPAGPAGAPRERPRPPERRTAPRRERQRSRSEVRRSGQAGPGRRRRSLPPITVALAVSAT